MFRNQFKISSLVAVVFAAVAISCLLATIYIYSNINNGIHNNLNWIPIAIFGGGFLFFASTAIGIFLRFDFIRKVIQFFSWLFIIGWFVSIWFFIQRLNFSEESINFDFSFVFIGLSILVLSFAFGFIGLFNSKRVREEFGAEDS